MNIINKNIMTTEIVKRSKFITYLFYVENTSSIKEILMQLKKEHHGATHVCYAYKIGAKTKSSDNFEPAGTAGKPMLKSLITMDMDQTLAVVVRYYGGIKLGVGPLAKTYGGCVINALKETGVKEIINEYLFEITFDLKYINQLDKFFQNQIKTKEIGLSARYLIALTNPDLINQVNHLLISYKQLNN